MIAAHSEFRIIREKLAPKSIKVFTISAHARLLGKHRRWQMSDSTDIKSVAEKLQQSLLNFKDQMSVYTTHGWSENGHGFNEPERLGFRDIPVPSPDLIGRGPGPGTRHTAVEQRIAFEREKEAPSHGTSHGHFEGGSRYVLL